MISIHVLHVEDDQCTAAGLTRAADFNPRPPCGGRRLFVLCAVGDLVISIHVLHVEDDRGQLHNRRGLYQFQSTSSMWRTTQEGEPLHGYVVFQSTSSMWRTTPPGWHSSSWIIISIHVLHVEDDDAPKSAGRCLSCISIHVLHVEDDGARLSIIQLDTNFNPRPPCGGRQPHKHPRSRSSAFQSTSSMWRTTHVYVGTYGLGAISIHVLHVEDDPRINSLFQLRQLFQSTSSMWRTTRHWRRGWKCTTFQSTSSMWRTTPYSRQTRRG